MLIQSLRFLKGPSFIIQEAETRQKWRWETHDWNSKQEVQGDGWPSALLCIIANSTITRKYDSFLVRDAYCLRPSPYTVFLPFCCNCIAINDEIRVLKQCIFVQPPTASNQLPGSHVPTFTGLLLALRRLLGFARNYYCFGTSQSVGLLLKVTFMVISFFSPFSVVNNFQICVEFYENKITYPYKSNLL